MDTHISSKSFILLRCDRTEEATFIRVEEELFDNAMAQCWVVASGASDYDPADEEVVFVVPQTWTY